MFEAYLEVQKYKLDNEKLNLDGTRSLVKKQQEVMTINLEKKGKLIMY